MSNGDSIVFPSFRVGSGYDVHRFSEERYDDIDKYIVLCGVRVPHSREIIAHSDGDVAIHALVDAMFGAIGCGDIGDHFPSDDEKWKNHNSSKFLLYASEKVNSCGYLVSNVDITIICEAPNISPYKEKMRIHIGDLLNLDQKMVNIKATTSEGLGFIGRDEGIAVQALVGCTLLERG